MAQDSGTSLADILSGIEHTLSGDGTGVVLSAITDDSRIVDKRSIFIAVKGSSVDGHMFIDDVVRKGCPAVVVQQGCRPQKLRGALFVEVSDTRSALGRMAANLYGHPARRLKVIGITGTNGKTTSTYLLEKIIRESGGNPGVIGTVNYRFNNVVLPASHTTPAPVRLQHLLLEMVNAGVTHVLMEVSSHALEQDRIEGLAFDAALFTNLSRDHLDYHGNMEHYFASKKKLFLRYLKDGGKAVIISGDSPVGQEELQGDSADWGARLAVELPRSAEWQAEGRGKDDIILCNAQRAAIQIISYRGSLSGTEAELEVSGERHFLRSDLLGRFNLRNILGVTGVSIALGIPAARALASLGGAISVPGRLERVRSKSGVTVVVDYAHTPDALENVLHSLRELGPKRLVVVFGCGGDRDRGKRRLMGSVAGKLADIVIVTSDNPRSEKPDAIIREIESGLVEQGVSRMRAEILLRRKRMLGYDLVVSRREAIGLVLRYAEQGDLVAICGKGHEDYQQIGKRKVFFDDRIEAARQSDVVCW